MRVLFLSWRDLGHRLAGGSEVLVDRLAAGLHERGHDVTLLAGGPVREHRYRVVDAGGRFRQYLTDPLVARRLGPQDVIVDVCNGIPFFSPLWTRTPAVVLVNHVHFGMWREWFSPPVSLLGATVETRVMPLAYRRRLCVAVSDSTARALATLGVPADQIRVVHNGVDQDPDHRPERSATPTFLALGRLVPHKRFDLLLRAWAQVQPRTGGRLVIAGGGPLLEELRASAPPHTEVIGHVTDDEKRALLDEAWLLVQPSRLEGWGLVVMEAAARGTPTLGFWAPGTRDAVDHETTGVLVRTERELVDAWASLANDVEQLDVLAKGAAARAGEFPWERSVGAFEAVLHEAIARLADRRRGPAAPPAPSGRPPRGSRQRLVEDVKDKIELFQLFTAERADPEPFYRRLAARSIAELPYQVEGRLILDLGAGPGHFAAALRDAGAAVIALDKDASDSSAGADRSLASVCGDGTRLPLSDASIDGIFCSNMLEHTPEPGAVLHEMARVVRPGGWAWVSWTNWYSPWGGHDITPFQYLGPTWGARAHRRLFGEPRKNAPGDGLWPTHIGHVLRQVAAEPMFEVRDVFPRYYPSQRWITRVPGLREVLTWNCVLLLHRREGVRTTAEPALVLDTTSTRAMARRGLRRARQALGDRPAFLPLVLRATPIGPSRAITPVTELVIEGFPRSGNTFAHFATLAAEPGAVITSRVHTPSQVKLAVRRRVPTLLTVRDPLDSIASTIVAAPHVPARTLLLEYIHHYEQLVPLLDDVVVATFNEITTDYGVVMDALNERFGLGFRRFEHTPESEAAVFAAIDGHHRDHWGDDEAGLPRPVEAQRHLKDRVRQEILRPELSALLLEAQTVHDTVAARSVAAAGR
ncbi:MAG: glycosyltransferase [Acidimicrobiales bacterium]